MKKLIKYSNGAAAITEDVVVVVTGATQVSEEDLSYLTDEDFKNISDKPKEFELVDKKVKKIKLDGPE